MSDPKPLTKEMAHARAAELLAIICEENDEIARREKRILAYREELATCKGMMAAFDAAALAAKTQEETVGRAID